MSQNWSY